MLSKKRVLLVGGAGTLGSDIINSVHSKYELYVIDNFSESALTEIEVQERVAYRNISVANEVEILHIFQSFKPEAVVYLSTTLSSDQVRNFESNVLGMSNTIKAAEATTLPKIIYIQSFLTRRNDSVIDYKSEIEARDAYSVWKSAAEYLLGAYKGRKTTMILASVVSSKLSVGAIPAFLRFIERNESINVTDTFRDYIAPDKFIAGLAMLLDDTISEEIVVLGSGNPLSTLEILKFTAAGLGKSFDEIQHEIIQPKSSDPKTISLDNTWYIQIGSEQQSIKSCVQVAVNELLNSQKQVRLHH